METHKVATRKADGKRRLCGEKRRLCARCSCRKIIRGAAHWFAWKGGERVCVENFKGICSCTADKISLAAGENRIHIIGKRLRIDCYTKEEIEISGLIETVTYLS